MDANLGHQLLPPLSIPTTGIEGGDLVNIKAQCFRNDWGVARLSRVLSSARD
jgi:hypothetical protein